MDSEGVGVMAKKKPAPTKEQTETIKKQGLSPLCWVVLQDLPHSMIVKHRVTGEVKVIDK